MSPRAALLGPGLALLIAAPAAATQPVRGVDYTGPLSGGGTISFHVSPNGRSLAEVRASRLAATCDGAPGVVSFGGGPVRVSRGGAFHQQIPDDAEIRFAGRFLPRGRATGSIGYSDRDGCLARAKLSVDALPGHPINHTPIFSFDSYASYRVGLTGAGVDALSDGSVLFADDAFDALDRRGEKIVRVALDGSVTNLAGTGASGFSGDGGPATRAQLKEPGDVAAVTGGGLLIADTGNRCVREVDAAGTISTVAGHCGDDSSASGAGDGGPATAATLVDPVAVAPTADGGFLIADERDARVRRVSADGIITTAAGTGTPGYSGDGGPAAAAQVGDPTDVDAIPGGGFLIADPDNERVRRVSPSGTISTAAGTGVGGLSPDGSPAGSARLDQPAGVAALGRRAFLISEWGRVLRVAATGRISTVAGPGLGTDGGPAGLAALAIPARVTPLPGGGFAMTNRRRLHLVTGGRTRLLVAIRASASPFNGGPLVHARVGRPVVLGLVSTRPCRVTVTLGRIGRKAPLLTARASIRGRRASVQFPRGLARGWYRLTATAVGERRRATAGGELQVR
jgi:hypothetical protein